MTAALLACLIMTSPGEQMTTVARGTLSAIDARREVVIRTAEDWNALWREHAPETPAPHVDLASHTLVALFLGTRPSAGYEVTITSIERDSDGVVVRYRATRPAPDAMNAQVLTSPFHIVAVPRFNGGARFERVDGQPAR